MAQLKKSRLAEWERSARTSPFTSTAGHDRRRLRSGVSDEELYGVDIVIPDIIT
jgi:hypothetical protein